jgi:hypothetical protein
MASRRRQILGAASLVIAGAAAYPLLVREWCITWGAGADEVNRGMPGDELIPNPDMLTTRAITIDAPPSAIWPWLVQMGSGRGGDWIENLFGLDMHSADAILPQFQELEVGDVLPLGPSGPGMRVEVLEPERFLTIRFEDETWVWSFGLYTEEGTTRLVSRNPISTPDASIVRRLFDLLLMEPGSLVMARKMLAGIKQRAERVRPR